jgi:hypothetical protein
VKNARLAELELMQTNPVFDGPRVTNDSLPAEKRKRLYIIGELVLCNCTERAEDDKMKLRRAKADVKKQLLKFPLGSGKMTTHVVQHRQPTALFFRQPYRLVSAFIRPWRSPENIPCEHYLHLRPQPQPSFFILNLATC